ncbi:hypothetical protein [Luteimonas salinilitoris]|uniref:Uncharacterized protein n=1 Tax=Luteimonas salinilitoris TaxID=3237697 RepID=A0ABV4HXY3_9GAMM
MRKLKVPSLQHLARTWHEDPKRITREFVALAKGGPTFSYEPLFESVRDLLVFSIPYLQIVEGVKRGVKRQDVRDNFLGLLPLIKDHFDGVSANFVHDVAPRFYSVGRDLMIPFNPPLIYGANDQIYFPWFSFWRSNPLSGERLSLFVSIVEEVLLQDSDLEDAKFSILDFSAPAARLPRELTVVDTSSIPRVSESRKAEMLSVFADGFIAARDAVSNMARHEVAEDDEDDSSVGQFLLDL